jgi:hypothetical protein
MPFFAHARCTSVSWARSGAGGLKMPSGALRIPSIDPVTPMNR